MMETQEAIEAADDADLDHWRDWADKERAKIVEQVSHAFASLSDTPASNELGSIRTQLNQWRYLERIIEQLNDA